jgi:methyl-accepting chemotaxis protein
MLTVILVFVCVAVVLQAVFMAGVWRSIQRLAREVEGIRADVARDLGPVAQSMAEILANSREPIRTITSNLAEISRVLRDRTGQVDRAVADLLDRSRLQIIRVDQMVSELVQKVESTADAVQRQVLAPITEISAVIKGLRSGLEFLFSRRRSPSASETTQDEQMFI